MSHGLQSNKYGMLCNIVLTETWQYGVMKIGNNVWAQGECRLLW